MRITLDDLKEAMQIADQNKVRIVRFELTPESISELKQDLHNSKNTVLICTRIVERKENKVVVVKTKHILKAIGIGIMPPNMFRTAEHNKILLRKSQ